MVPPRNQLVAGNPGMPIPSPWQIGCRLIVYVAIYNYLLALVWVSHIVLVAPNGILINSDAGMANDGTGVGMEVVARDGHGRILFSAGQFLSSTLDVELAELGWLWRMVCNKLFLRLILFLQFLGSPQSNLVCLFII